MKVKICGITNLEDAAFAALCGADDLGFNFYKKSARYITPEQAKLIISSIDADVLKVGVFVNETAANVCEIASLAGLNVVQLHGDEDNKFIEEVHSLSGLPVIKAFRVTPEFNIDIVRSCSGEAVLLDKYSATEMGGTGETFDWAIAAEVKGAVERLYLAGGLTPENVAEAIRRVRPYAVDACSCLESSPGKKDPEKVAAFIRTAKEAI
ncbi:MAG: phosphoribosylanthranilate isomerase [Acidobacteriota bacterium]